jgi:hypothetical protein
MGAILFTKYNFYFNKFVTIFNERDHVQFAYVNEILANALFQGESTLQFHSEVNYAILLFSTFNFYKPLPILVPALLTYLNSSRSMA